MKVQLQNNQNYPIKRQNNQQEMTNKTQTSFKGFSGALNYFATNMGVGACATDLGFMVIPRTANEIPRGFDAAAEAGFRESFGTTNHAAIGAYGLAGGALLGGALASQYGVEATRIFTSPDRVEALAKFWAEHIEKNTTQKEYLAKIVDEIAGYNTTRAEGSTFINLAKEDKAKIVEVLDSAINNKDFDRMNSVWRKSNERGILAALVTESTGAEARIKLNNGGTSDVKSLMDDIVGMTKAFKKEKVTAQFIEAAKGNENKFLKTMSRFNKGRALFGFLVGSGIGMSVQPINMWITKKRTGKTGFVGGSENCGKDTSTKFLLERVGVATAMGAMVLATLKCNPKDFLNKMAFKGMAPTLDQLKGIYGATILGRVMVTRSEDELRESSVKDTCGFLSWLVLGDFVNRGVAHAFYGKKLWNYNKGIDGNQFTGSVLKSRSEILREALRGVGISTITKDAKTGMDRAMGIDEMMKELKNNPLAKLIQKSTRKKLWALNGAQIAGYAFTGVALGAGIPMLNIHMTRKAEAKRRHKAEQQRMLAEQQQMNVDMKPEGLTVKQAV